MKIDTTKQPQIPYDNWTIESHNTSLGNIDLTKVKFELYLDNAQKDGKYIEGNKLREKLKDKPVLNAVVLDYLLEHQELIPESWKKKTKEGYIQYIYFWGTIYRDSLDNLYVRYICFIDGAWIRFYGWLGGGWDGYNPAAVASSLPSKTKSLPSNHLDLEKRIKKIENWIDFWETVRTPWDKNK